MTYRMPKQRVANAVLLETDVREIRRALIKKVLVRTLADHYHVSLETIRRIGRHETWRWLETYADEVADENPYNFHPRVMQDPPSQEHIDEQLAMLKQAEEMRLAKLDKQPITADQFKKLEGFGINMKKYVITDDAAKAMFGGLTAEPPTGDGVIDLDKEVGK